MTSVLRRKRAAFLAAVFSIAVIATVVLFYLTYNDQKLFEISVLDVGQGDAILFEAPTGQVMLVDGGPDKRILRRLGEELPFWERRIDMIVVSHPHEDHYGGLQSVVERYSVGVVLLTGIETRSQSYQQFVQTVQKRNIPIYLVEKQEQVSLGDVQLDIIYPDHSLKGHWISNLNNSSIVIRVAYKEIDMLLTGDAEEEEEAELIATGVDVTADILKVGHHGSDTSSTESFVKAVSPEIAVISSGKGNKYGHPSLRTLRRLERLGISIRRTDTEGTIRFRTDGLKLY